MGRRNRQRSETERLVQIIAQLARSGSGHGWIRVTDRLVVLWKDPSRAVKLTAKS